MARPEFKPTKAQRRSVSIAAAAGIAQEEIAIQLGVAKMTLRKHFAFELTQGAYRKRQEVLNGLFRAAKKGNVSAAKRFLDATPEIAAPLDVVGKPPGKKEQAAADAVTAQIGTDWDSLLAPAGKPLQ
jgi:hypothetical protein